MLPLPPKPRLRLRGLDGLRFLAAAAVVAYHYTGVATHYWGAIPAEVFPTLNVVTRYGYLGVELFFIISGFVILMTAYGKDVTTFTASRISRLFPAYWVAVLLTLVLEAVWSGGRQVSHSDALVNLTMIQGAFDVPSVQGAFWTLWTELKFYLLIGVFVTIGMTRGRVIAFATLWPLLGQLAVATDSGMLRSLLIPTYAPYFALGMMLFLVFRDGNDLLVWLVAAYNLVLCVQQITGYSERVTGYVGAPVSATISAAVVVAAAALVWALTAGPLRSLDWRWLTVAGALTYPLYLVHGQFGFAVIDALHDKVNTYVVLGLAVVVALVLAVAIHYLVERRVHEKLRSAVRHSLTRPAHVSTKGAPPPVPATETGSGSR